MKWLRRLPIFLLRNPLWIFLLWAGWLSLEYWALGDFSYLFIHDNADQIIPVSSWLTESPSRLFTESLLPEMCGVDRFATTAWVNMHRLLCLIMPAWLAHGLFIFIQRFVAGYFTCRVLKDGFKVPPIIAVSAGMAYSLIGLEHGEMRLMHNLNEPGFPLMIWMLIAFPINRFGVGILASLVGGLFFSLSMGPIGAWPFFFPTAILVALIIRKDLSGGANIGKFLLLVFLFTIAFLSLRIPNLMAMVPNGALSHRSDWSAYPTFFLQFRHLLSTRLPMLLPWWGVLICGLLWVFQWRGRGRRDVAVLCLLLVGIMFGPLIQSASVALKEQIGFLGGFNFTRFDRVLPFALIAMAALGISRLANQVVNEEWLQMKLSSLIAIGLIGMCAQESVAQKKLHLAGIQQEGKSWRTIYGNPEVAALAKDIEGQQVRCVTAGAYHAFHPLYAMPHGLEIADGYVVMYPNYYQHFWGEVVRPLTEQEPEYFEGHFNKWGSRVYLFHSSREVNANIPQIPFEDWYNLDLLSLANVRYIISRKPVSDERLTLRPQVMTEEVRDAWWALSPKEKARGYVNGKNPGAPMYIYENKQAVDRFFVARNCQWFDDEESVFEHLSTNSIGSLTNTVCLLQADRKTPAVFNSTDGPLDTVIDVLPREQSDLHILRVTSSTDSWLVFSSLYYPWWKCTIDEDESQIFRAYGAFMAVRVPAGDRRVRFSYEPPYRLFK